MLALAIREIQLVIMVGVSEIFELGYNYLIFFRLQAFTAFLSQDCSTNRYFLTQNPHHFKHYHFLGYPTRIQELTTSRVMSVYELFMVLNISLLSRQIHQTSHAYGRLALRRH